MLYVVGTPIGNLYDLSYRQGKILSEAEIILTEDTRSTGQLLIKIRELFDFEINTNQRLISYYKEKEFEKLPEIIDWLEEGKLIALISQAGMPLISDPGSLLMKSVIQKHIPYTVVPGPSAVTTALLHTGWKTEQFMFLGFLPKKQNDLKKILEKIKQVKSIFKDVVYIAFESPNRINDTLKIISEILPDSRITITRELTKKFEEVIHGSPSELINREYKGEITLLIS